MAYDPETGSTIVIYEDGGDSRQGNARVVEVPEFSSIFLPILSTLLIVGFNYRRKRS